MFLNELIDNLNKQPINQVAMIFLKRAGVKPDPSMLYLYQLIEWVLDSGKIEVHDVTNSYATYDLLEATRSLMYMDDAEKALNFLTKNGPDDGSPEYQWVDPVEFAKQETPLDAAQYLAERLMFALQHEEPSDRVGDLS